MYTELQVTTNFSFLRGASEVDELFAQAAMLGLKAMAVTDRNTLAGIVRAHLRAKEVGVRLIPGCRLDFSDCPPILVYPTHREGWSRLCRLLTLGKGRAGKGACELSWADLVAHAEGLVAVLCDVPADIEAGSEQREKILPSPRPPPSRGGGELSSSSSISPFLSHSSLSSFPPAPSTPFTLQHFRAVFPNRGYIALTLRRRPNDAVRLRQTADIAQRAKIPTVVTGNVLYHTPERRILQDVLTCIRETTPIDRIGFKRERSADRALKPPEEMARLFAAYPEALARSEEIADLCRFSLDELRYQYPHETRFPGLTAQQTLERLTWEGAAIRYPGTLPDTVVKQLNHELKLIAELEYAPYFLTVDSIVRFARSRHILCQGRGSAANSAVCYVLGITSIDPTRSGLLFERFISAARKEPPDIDVDFEHERREEVIQWVFETYGRERSALCATVIRYRGRGAVRDVGKAMGLPEDVTAALAGQMSHWGDQDDLSELNFNKEDRRLRLTMDLARMLIGFPRHLSQHPGGFVLTQDRLDDLVPIEPASMVNRQTIEWDKDDIEALHFMKVDVLGLGMLGCMRRGFDLLAQHRGLRIDLAGVPPEDPETYAMIRKADTIGTFQIESRAQMSMLPRLKPRTFYDIVIQVAIVRPGPIQGDMVHPYLRRREGIEPVEYPTEALRRVLEKTLGVPLFQEQAMQVAIVCAGFSPDEADALRRSMSTFKFTGGVHHFHDKMIAGMLERGYTRDFAERTFSQIEGFGSYGFPESHAASFALIAYASAWLKCHHPDVFCCALLNAQPMGFYAPAQIVRDARLHGVEVRPVCVNASAWDCTLEPCRGRYFAVRMGLRMAKGLNSTHADTVIARRGARPYQSVEDMHRRSGVPVSALEKLAEADAFQSLGLNRRDALWTIRGLSDTSLPLFDGLSPVMAGEGPPSTTSPDASRGLRAFARHDTEEPHVPLMPMTAGRQVVEDYRSTGLSLRRHPVSFLRQDLAARGIVRCADLETLKDGKRLTVAGIVLVRQRPGSARGVLFVTLEDETGHANLIVWPPLFEKQRRLILSATMIACRGKLQRESGVIHVIADELTDLSDLLKSVGEREIEGQTVRDIHVRSGSGIRVPTRDFR
jgi:error-prone DNA polymerase